MSLIVSAQIMKFGFLRLINDVWVCVDWANMITLFVVLGLRIKWLMMVSEIDFAKVSSDEYINLMPVAAAVVTENRANSISTYLLRCAEGS